jgi:predicted dehydrogenase
MPSVPVVRFGILGAARVAPYGLIQPARGTEGVRVHAIASRTLTKAQAFAAAHKIPTAYGSYQALLADPAIDAVYVALPPSLHAEWTCRALTAGKHVLCEKPLALNADQAAEVVATARRSNRVALEAMHFLYLDTLREQRRLVASGEFGRLLRVESCVRFSEIVYAAGDFRLSYALGGGAGSDLGGCAVACLRRVSGEEPEVIATRYRIQTPQVDSWMQSTLRLPSGAEAIAECGLKGPYRPRFGVTVTCERGTIAWDEDGLVCTRDGHVTKRKLPGSWTYQLQLEAFVRRLRGQPSAAPPMEDAIATARVVDAMYDRAGLARRGTMVNA